MVPLKRTFRSTSGWFWGSRIARNDMTRRNSRSLGKSFASDVFQQFGCLNTPKLTYGTWKDAILKGNYLSAIHFREGKSKTRWTWMAIARKHQESIECVDDSWCSVPKINSTPKKWLSKSNPPPKWPSRLKWRSSFSCGLPEEPLWMILKFVLVSVKATRLLYRIRKPYILLQMERMLFRILVLFHVNSKARHTPCMLYIRGEAPFLNKLRKHVSLLSSNAAQQ